MTHLPRLASMVFNRVHWIEPAAAETILAVLDGRIGDLRMSRFEGEAAFTREGRWKGYQVTPRGTAIVPIVGELVNRGAYLGASSGLVSYEGVRQQLKNAASDQAVRAVVLDIDSPGGMVAGCAETAALVREISKTKAVVACANSDTCSAAYAIASGANAIVATESSRVGSIGVLFVHANRQRELDKKGIDVTIFQGGKHKTDGHPFGPLSAEVAAEIQGNIDAHYDAFVKLVVAGRPQLSEQQIRGTEARVYRGADAVAQGLADYVGTFEQAVALAESGHVPKRQQAVSSVPAPATQPQKVAAIKGAIRMTTLPNTPVSGYEGLSPDALNQIVATLCDTLGIEASDQQPGAAAGASPQAARQAPATQPSETIDQAVVRGRSEEKARIKGILALPEARERPLAALALAVETDIPVTAAGATLARIPAEAQGKGGGYLRAAIEANGGSPKVSHMTPTADQPKASTLSASMDRMLAKLPQSKRAKTS
jgi:signal peptide peptidase SppA